MKIRTDFVSNSSSSSFVLIGKIFDTDELSKTVDASSGFLEKFNKDHEENFETLEDAISEYGMFDVVDCFLEKSGLEVQTEECDWDDSGRIAIGLDPSSKMKNNETLGDFKKRVAEKITAAGFTTSAKDVVFITGGSDAGGTSFFYDRG